MKMIWLFCCISFMSSMFPSESRAAIITVHCLVSDTEYENSFGWYVSNDYGAPAYGEVIWGNVKASANSTSQINLPGLLPEQVGLFLLPDAWHYPVANGDPVSFLPSTYGGWAAVDGSGQTIVGQALFTASELNPGGHYYEIDNPSIEGNSNWEDKDFLPMPQSIFNYAEANFQIVVVTDPYVVPLPASFLLLLSGLITGAGLRKRYKGSRPYFWKKLVVNTSPDTSMPPLFTNRRHLFM